MIISLIITLIIIGVCLYLVELIPMDGAIKQAIRVIVILMVILYILQAFGVIGHINGIKL